MTNTSIPTISLTTLYINWFGLTIYRLSLFLPISVVIFIIKKRTKVLEFYSQKKNKKTKKEELKLLFLAYKNKTINIIFMIIYIFLKTYTRQDRRNL